jgi:hypothetical protein
MANEPIVTWAAPASAPTQELKCHAEYPPLEHNLTIPAFRPVAPPEGQSAEQLARKVTWNGEQWVPLKDAKAFAASQVSAATERAEYAMEAMAQSNQENWSRAEKAKAELERLRTGPASAPQQGTCSYKFHNVPEGHKHFENPRCLDFKSVAPPEDQSAEQGNFPRGWLNASDKKLDYVTELLNSSASTECIEQTLAAYAASQVSAARAEIEMLTCERDEYKLLHEERRAELERLREALRDLENKIIDFDAARGGPKPEGKK